MVFLNITIEFYLFLGEGGRFSLEVYSKYLSQYLFLHKCFYWFSFCEERIYYSKCTDLIDDEVNGELIVVT